MDQFKSAVILAGGKSSRMGFDKQFLKIQEKRLIDIISKKLKAEFDEIIIVTNKKEEYAGGNYRAICDEIPGQGPLSGIHAGLRAASSKYVYFIACDMPDLNLQYIRRMKQKLKDSQKDGCICELNSKIEPFNSFYSKKVIGNIERALQDGVRSVHRLSKTLDLVVIQEDEVQKYDRPLSMFSNLNTKEDLKEYLNTKEASSFGGFK